MPMNRLAIVAAALCGLLSCSPDLAAQNLVITNARIVTGAGTVIERGSIVVRDGRIVSVAAGAATGQGQTDRCARHDGVARLHRCPPAHHERQRRPVVQGTVDRPDAGVPRSRVHDADVRRWSLPGNPRVEAAGRERSTQRPADHHLRSRRSGQLQDRGPRAGAGPQVRASGHRDHQGAHRSRAHRRAEDDPGRRRGRGDGRTSSM